MQHGAGVQANFFLFWHDFPLIPTLSEGLSFPCCEYLGIFSRNSLIMYVAAFWVTLFHSPCACLPEGPRPPPVFLITDVLQ